VVDLNIFYYILTDYIMYIMHPCSLSYRNDFLCYIHIFKIQNFEDQKHKLEIGEINFVTHWNCSNFEKQWYYTFDKEEGDLEKKIANHIFKTLYTFKLLKHHQFESNFEHWNFTSNKIYSLEKIYWQSKLLHYPYDLSKIHKYSPSHLVALLIMCAS
jgi:hypothetical protein